MNLWHDIPSKNDNGLNVIIEIPKLSRVKYELDKDTGLIKVDRVLYSPMHYPTDYGFVPRTLWDDNDPLDVLVMNMEGYVPGCLVEARPIGALEMNDGGEDDLKVLAVPVADPRFKNTNDLEDIESHHLLEIKHFFQVYKDLQNKKVKIGEWIGSAKANEAVVRAMKMYQEKYEK